MGRLKELRKIVDAEINRMENPDKRREYQERYWQKKTQSDRQKTAENGGKEGEKE